MSDEELLNRQYELSRRLGWASRFSGSDMTSQLWSMISAIEAERRDRVLKIMFSERQKLFPDVIESEPDLAAKNKNKVVSDEKDDRMTNRRKIGRERLALTKTSTPVSQQPTPYERSAQPEPDPDIEGKDEDDKEK